MIGCCSLARATVAQSFLSDVFFYGREVQVFKGAFAFMDMHSTLLDFGPLVKFDLGGDLVGLAPLVDKYIQTARMVHPTANGKDKTLTAMVKKLRSHFRKLEAEEQSR